jgi:hypothetical protein
MKDNIPETNRQMLSVTIGSHYTFYMLAVHKCTLSYAVLSMRCVEVINENSIQAGVNDMLLHHVILYIKRSHKPV